MFGWVFVCLNDELGVEASREAEPPGVGEWFEGADAHVFVDGVADWFDVELPVTGPQGAEVFGLVGEEILEDFLEAVGFIAEGAVFVLGVEIEDAFGEGCEVFAALPDVEHVEIAGGTAAQGDDCGLVATA